MAHLTYDIVLLGLRDVDAPARTRFVNAMERLTGRPASEHRNVLSRSMEPLFRGLDQDKAEIVWKTLDEVGGLVEVRKSAGGRSEGDELSNLTCPTCGFIQPAGGAECQRCGVVFAKFEREKIQKMQKDRRLEEALQKALQVREEWTNRAKHYLEGHPLPEDATIGFDGDLLRDEIPFVRLNADEGPLLMTSRRLLFKVKDSRVESVPYELISDVDFGGGLVVKKNHVRFSLTFHSEIPIEGSVARSSVWQLDKESSFLKEIIMDWCFARNFMCGSCGQRELDFRLEGTRPHARCMHCATDHEIDLSEAIAIPQIQE